MPTAYAYNRVSDNQTKYYGFPLWDAFDQENTFLTYRLSINGTDQDSTFNLIDNILHEFDVRISGIGDANIRVVVNAIYEQENQYSGQNPAITEYIQGYVMFLSLNQENTGQVTLNINNLGNKSVNIRSATGEITPLGAGMLKKDTYYLCYYDGTQWIIPSVPVASEAYKASMAVNANNVTTQINGNNITDIFEENGTTVKNATNAINATNADNATNAENATNATNATNAQSSVNVTTSINGQAITNIFETDGITAKKATTSEQANTANTATNAENIDGGTF